MAARLSIWAKKNPLLAFYILAFAITWLGWMPQAAYSRGLFPFDSPLFYVLGGTGPLLATFIMLRVLRGKEDFWSLFRPLWQWRAKMIWYFVALFGFTAMWLATLIISGDLSTELAKVGPPLALLSSFLIYFVAAIPEEIAWRGFALPRLQSRYSALVSSLIVGFLWAIWHLPLLLNTDSIMSTYPFVLFVLDVMARSVVYAWIFNSTRGSLLFVTLFHASSNTVGTFIGVENLVVTYFVAAILIIVFGAAHLSRRGERSVETDIPLIAAETG